MPLIGTRGAVSANALGLFSAGGSNWLSTYSTPQLNRTNTIACDANGNLYAGGLDNIGFNTFIQISKINPFGTLLWQKNITTSPTYNIFTNAPAISCDINGNIYCFGTIKDPSTSIEFLYISKYDTNGVFLWGRTLQVFSVNVTLNDLKIAIDSAFNVIVVGSVYDGVNGSNIQIVKYNSSGVLQWQKQLLSPSGFAQDYGRGVTTDASNNVYITGSIDSLSTPLVAKYNSSGVLQWQKYQSTVLTSTVMTDIGSDGTDVYILGGSTVMTGPVYIFKYSNSGTLLWQRQLQVNQTVQDSGQITVTGSGDVYYCCGEGLGASPAPAIVAKYNSSGVLQWQRSIGVTDPSERTSGTGAAIDSKGALLVQLFGSSGVGAGAIMARLPSNGTKTGTYALSSYNVAYTATTFTESATSFTSSTLSATDTTTTWVDAAFTPTVTNSSLSYVITQI